MKESFACSKQRLHGNEMFLSYIYPCFMELFWQICDRLNVPFLKYSNIQNESFNVLRIVVIVSPPGVCPRSKCCCTSANCVGWVKTDFNFLTERSCEASEVDKFALPCASLRQKHESAALITFKDDFCIGNKDN